MESTYEGKPKTSGLRARLDGGRRLKIVTIPMAYVLATLKEGPMNVRVAGGFLPADARFLWVVTYEQEWQQVHYGLRVVIESSEFAEVAEGQLIPEFGEFLLERV